MWDLRRRYPKGCTFVTGNFNAHHPEWGHPSAGARGTLLRETAEAACLALVNDLDYLTRHGLNVRNTSTRMRPSQAIHWDVFRSTVVMCKATSPIFEKLQRAKQDYTMEIEVLKGGPVPDKHLFNLWEMCRQLHDHYLRNGRWFKDFPKVRNRTAQARHYARRLSRSRSFSHCVSFNKTGARYLPSDDAANATRSILLTTDFSLQDLEREAAHTFFLQPVTLPDPNMYLLHRPEDDRVQNSPFTLQELTLAPQSVDVGSTPGRTMLCGVCYVIY